MSQSLSSSVQKENLKAHSPPTTSTSFLEWLRDRHHAVFASDLPEIAGKFRTDEIFFGGIGTRHEREGAKPEDIESDLIGVFERFQGELNNAPIEKLIARFLQRFFEVHPFNDGNGRIGRLFAASVAKEQGYEFNHDKRAGEGKYLEALEEAHLWCARKSDARQRMRDWDRRRPRNPYKLLEEYVASVLFSRNQDSTVETPPFSE